MGKGSREKMLGIGYKEKALMKIRDMIKEGRTIEDKEATMFFINLRKMRVTPKDKNVDIKDFHKRFIERLISRKVFNIINCYIDEDGKSVILEV